jgi:four helix bundle protein
MLRIYEKCKSMCRRVEAMSKLVHPHNAKQADEMRRASKSCRSNVAEGSGVRGGHRRQHYDRALGSARETRDAVEEAVEERWAPYDAELDDELDHIIAVLVKNVR